jgi:nucleotide-binding universal stress UspA family protein
MITTTTSLFYRILVAVDSSDYAMKAFEYAIQLAQIVVTAKKRKL